MSVNLFLVLFAALNYFAYSLRVPQPPVRYDSGDGTLPTMNPKPSQELQHRSAAIVDLNSIPVDECFLGDYLDDCHFQPPTFVPTCPLVSAPCNNSYDTNCKSYTLDCFCKAPTPLSCAWDCAWRGWMYVEDWFSKTCPDTPPVDFGTLPSCARDCVSDNSFSYGCITESRNCFCLHETLFNCTVLCNDQGDTENVIDWYATTCGTTKAEATAVANNTNFSFQFTSILAGGKQDVVIQPPKSHKLRWYEILVIFTAVLTAFVAVVFTSALYLFKNNLLDKLKEVKLKEEQDAYVEVGRNDKNR